MINELIVLIEKQDEKLRDLGKLLEKQYESLMKKDLYGLQDIIDEINSCGKEIAQLEVDRRNIMGTEKLSEFVKENNTSKLNKVYESITKTLHDVKMQKDTNELLIKQQVVFNNKMLQIMNPNREIKTYNSYGGLK